MTPQAAHDREEGRAAVAALCDAFAADLGYYKSADFDETTTRQRFIDPFFAALGWDVSDEDKRGPFADVLLEYSLKAKKVSDEQISLLEEEERLIEEAVESGEEIEAVGVRRPDYSFRLQGERKFFVEAKRPSVNIESPGPIYQVKSYGWSAGVSLVLLTDFEQFLAFDCRYKPVLGEPLTGLLPEFRLGFEEYVENWDLLWDTFSREAVAGGSLDAYLEEVEDRKGQLPVDQAFLADLGRWRSVLAQDLAERNHELDVWQLNDATQRTLDRLVFVRVCEDRRLEPEEILRPLLELEDPYPAFIEAIAPLRENYNGGLLDRDQVDELTVSPEAFKALIKGLYTPWSPYRFDVLGVEILGSIYERALGSMVTLDEDRKVSVELKPEVRKAGGVYYTPQWVVEEIVRLTLDPLLAGRKPSDVKKLRVLDPACGSGSFLLGAFARLLRFYESYYEAHPKTDAADHFEDSLGTRRLTADAKAKVLQRHIFGVDVDPAAVEVTTMSLYLKSLESDAPEYVRTQMRLSGAILPSLYSNIRCGNSLVSTDFYAQEQLVEALDDYEEHRLRPFRWDDDKEGFGSVLADGGFDVVIGNPPYFNVDATYGAGHPVPAYLKQAYSDVWLDKTDIYYYFLRKGAELAQSRLCFIVSRAVLEAEKAKHTRAWLTANCRLNELIDFDGFLVFADAGIATAILDFDTTTAHDGAAVAVRRLDSGKYSPTEVAVGMVEHKEPFEVFNRETALGADPWHFPNPYEDALFERIDAAGDPLDAVVDLGKGMETAANNVFGKISAEEAESEGLPAEILKPRAHNSDIHRFWIERSDELVLYLEDFSRFEDLPASVQTYLEEPARKAKLEGRAAYKRGDCEWWKYTWPLHKELHDRARLVAPYRTGHLRFALDQDFTYFTSTDTTIGFERDDVREDLLYVLGLLNSSLMTFRFRGQAKLTGDGMWECFHTSVKNLPIVRMDLDDAEQRARHDAVVGLTKDLQRLRAAAEEAPSSTERSTAARKVEAKLTALDQLVLDIYGITDAEERSTVLALGSPL